MEFTSFLAVESWLAELDLLFDRHKCVAPRFIKPFHLATIAHKMRVKQVHTLDLPEKVAPYANTMKLWEALNLTPPQMIAERQAPGRHHPIEVLRDVACVEDTAAHLVRLFASVCLDERTLDAVNTMLRELLDNCYSHAEVPDGISGMVCAQVWGGGKKAQIAIVDTGVGIRNSLLGNRELAERLERENGCELATEYGVTSKPGRGHSGYGLAVARKLMEQNRGNLMLRSGTEGYSWCEGRETRFNTGRELRGTLLIIEWNLRVPMNIGLVYEGFPLPEGMNDDDFDF